METIKRKIKAGIKQFLPGHLPNFLIIGAQKCATTSLHNYLSQHPEIVGSRPKEIHFFDNEETYERGLDWYCHNFPNTKPFNGNLRYFESSPSYLYNAAVPERIFNLSASIKLIIVLRDPVQRAFSAWNMYYSFLKNGYIKKFIIDPFPPNKFNPLLHYYYQADKFPAFMEAIKLELSFINNGGPDEPSIFRRGLYAQQIKTYLKYFSRDQILIIGFKDLVKDLPGTLKGIYDFLGVSSFPFSKLSIESRNKGIYDETLSNEDAEFVNSLYEKANDELVDILGTRLNW